MGIFLLQLGSNYSRKEDRRWSLAFGRWQKHRFQMTAQAVKAKRPKANDQGPTTSLPED
jgi:hypothetical protein